MSIAESPGRRVKAQVLSGFRDQQPRQMLLRRELIERFRTVFERHGFEPIDTPALEHLEVLTGKAGENEKLMYHFVDHGDRAVGLRYDLTVPLARFVANHQNDVPMPFKRYHIAPVWRAEKAQRGRFREFWQCDADIVGSASVIADAEAISIVGEILESLGLPQFTISISHRKLLEGLARAAGVPADSAPTVYRAVDKLHKIGAAGVSTELIDAGIDADAATRLLDLITAGGDNATVLTRVAEHVASDSDATAAVENLASLFRALTAISPGGECFKLDLTLARGLDYYTGIVYEATVEEPKVGSVSGGGRYDGLVGMFSGRDIPATGISIGLERIVEVAEEFQLFPVRETVCDTIVLHQESTVPAAAAIATTLREAGLNVDFSVVGKKGFGDQLKYAERRGIPTAVIVGPDEVERNEATVKHLQTGRQDHVRLYELASRVRELSRAG